MNALSWGMCQQLTTGIIALAQSLPCPPPLSTLLQELLANMDLLQSPSPTASTASSGGYPGGQAAHLAAALRELQAENEGLRAELSRSASGYSAAAAASSSLRSIAQGLQSISAGGGAGGGPAAASRGAQSMGSSR